MKSYGRKGFSCTITVVGTSVKGESLFYPVNVWVVMSDPVKADEEVCFSKVEDDEVPKVWVSIYIHA